MIGAYLAAARNPCRLGLLGAVGAGRRLVRFYCCIVPGILPVRFSCHFLLPPPALSQAAKFPPSFLRAGRCPSGASGTHSIPSEALLVLPSVSLLSRLDVPTTAPRHWPGLEESSTHALQCGADVRYGYGYLRSRGQARRGKVTSPSSRPLFLNVSMRAQSVQCYIAANRHGRWTLLHPTKERRSKRSTGIFSVFPARQRAVHIPARRRRPPRSTEYLTECA